MASNTLLNYFKKTPAKTEGTVKKLTDEDKENSAKKPPKMEKMDTDDDDDEVVRKPIRPLQNSVCSQFRQQKGLKQQINIIKLWNNRAQSGTLKKKTTKKSRQEKPNVDVLWLNPILNQVAFQTLFLLIYYLKLRSIKYLENDENAKDYEMKQEVKSSSEDEEPVVKSKPPKVVI